MKKLLLILILTAVAFGFTPSYVAFNNGQVSPLMEARTDYEKYTSSNRTVENFFTNVQGSALRRPGTRYIADANTAIAKVVRLLPFEVSTDDTYIIEITDGSMRFYRDDGT